eukprot:ANDGO_04378.mRNA.1 putative N-acetyltransferase C825.04c
MSTTKLREPSDIAALAQHELSQWAGSNSRGYSVQFEHGKTMSAGVLDAVMKLTGDNMRSLYQQSSWGWNAKKKRREMVHPDHRLILAFHDSVLVAFAAFRFTHEDDYEPAEECVYVYEVQVAQAFERKGLGSMLMRCVEQIALRTPCRSRVLLTVFYHNKSAREFYAKLGYEIDETSPDIVLKKNPLEARKYDYFILCKKCAA